MKELYKIIDQAYQERKDKLAPEIEELKKSQKGTPQEAYRNAKDQIEKLEHSISFLERKENFNILIEKTQSQLMDTMNLELWGEIKEKILTFIFNSPKGLKSLTSLYDKSKHASRMIKHFSYYTLEEIEELSKMPELPSITGILSGKGLYCSLKEIKDFIAMVKELNLDIRAVATKYNRKGLPSREELVNINKA